MLPLHDTQVRLVLLNHVTVRLADGQPAELDAAGIGNEQHQPYLGIVKRQHHA